MQDVSLAGAALQDSVFTEAFDHVYAVATSDRTGPQAAAARSRSGATAAVRRIFPSQPTPTM